MMDDVFIYHAHMFFVLFCACVGYLDFVSTSTSALWRMHKDTPSRWHPSWAWILWIILHVLLAPFARMFEILLSPMIATFPCFMTYIPCVLHPILGLLATIIWLVAPISFLHICHVPLLVTCLTWLPHTWWTIALSVVLSATQFSLYHVHIMLGLSCTWPMCLDTSFYLVFWMLLMPTIDLSLSALPMLAMTLR